MTRAEGQAHREAIMAKQKSELISAVGVLLSIVTALVTAVRKYGGDNEDIYRLATPDGETLVDKIGKLLAEAGQSVKNLFTLAVDYSRSLEQMVGAGKYDWMNDNITGNNFPHQSLGVVEQRCKLFHFNRSISSEDVITEMKKEGFIPADTATLCVFGEKFPEKQREFPIVALGQVWRSASGDRGVAYLNGVGAGRGLSLDWFDFDWSGDYRFLAVRK